MKLTHFLAGVSATFVAAELPSTPFLGESDVTKIPTSYESAVMGRRILALSKLATLTTVFPSPGEHSGENGMSAWENRPEGMGGVPIGLVDYVANCEDDGNPTVLAIKIATSFKNVREGSNISMALRWAPPYPPKRRMGFWSRLSTYFPFLSHESHYNSPPEAEVSPDPFPYSVANLPRFTLFGYLEPINPDAVSAVRLAACFTRKHQDAKWWLPGNVIHESYWARLVVTNIYWVGGFGDRAYIGWIPIEDWQNVTTEEWSSIKLPGEEKGWSEWSVNPFDEL